VQTKTTHAKEKLVFSFRLWLNTKTGKAVRRNKHRQTGATKMSLIQLSKISGVSISEDEVQTETTQPVFVNPTTIRCFYARRGDKPGTRITFTDGGGFAVSELPEAVANAIDVGVAA
jgi:hypothetical protein